MIGASADAALLDARASGTGGPSFSFRNRVERTLFMLVWAVLASWTPPPLHGWRRFILRVFGARIGHKVRLYGSVRIWHPAFLRIDNEATIGPGVRLYNQGKITIGARAVVSQGTHVCASTHDTADPHFQLKLCPIVIEEDAWIAADAFVGPGVKVGCGAVLGARGAAFRDLQPWTIYGGNPARFIKLRTMRAE